MIILTSVTNKKTNFHYIVPYQLEPYYSHDIYKINKSIHLHILLDQLEHGYSHEVNKINKSIHLYIDPHK